MNERIWIWIVVGAGVLGAQVLGAQSAPAEKLAEKIGQRVADRVADKVAEKMDERTADRVSIPFRDPSRPGLVKMTSLYGSILVKVHAGNDVVVEGGGKAIERKREVPEAAKGVRRLNTRTTNLSMEEDGNVVSISANWKNRSEVLVVLVPKKTSLKLGTTNGRLIQVDGVEGDMELNAVNGNIVLNDVSGSVVAHALNGKLTAKFVQVSPEKPMSFSSMNGTIDVTFPPTLKANLKIQSYNGDVFTDFDVQMKPTTVQVEKSGPMTGKGEGGRNRIATESVAMGTIQGGAEYSFKNFNGNIYIRKGN